jgi:hypothetical protein
MLLDSTEWELSWTNLANNGDILKYVVVRDLTPPAA